jgi:hypothetical protein
MSNAGATLASDVGSGSRTPSKSVVEFWRRPSFWDAPPYWALLLFTFLVSSTAIWSADIYWHVRAGQLIWEAGAVPRMDPFDYFGAERVWVDLWWGFELLVAGAYGLGGAVGLSILKALLPVLVIAIAWHAAGANLSAAARVACWLLPIVCLSSRAVLRPELLTLVHLALWLVILEGAERRPRWLWLLPVSQMLWVNSQGLFVLGPILWSLFFADHLLRKRWPERWGLSRTASAPATQSLIALTALIALACFANPYFHAGVLLPIEQFGMLDWSVSEFQSPFAMLRKGAAGVNYVPPLIALWLATLASFVWLARVGRVSPFRILVFVAFSYLAAEAFRNISLFSVVSGVLLCGNCGDAIRARTPESLAEDERASGGPGLRRRVIGSLASCAVLLVLAASVVTNHWHDYWNWGFLRFAYGERPDYYSHEAVRFAGQPGFPLHAFVANELDAAAYVLHNAPERRVYFYTRGEGAVEKFKNHYRLLKWMSKADPRWVETVSDPVVGHPVVIIPLSYRAVIEGVSHTPGWRMVHLSRSVVFMREEAAERLGLRDRQPGEIPN